MPSALAPISTDPHGACTDRSMVASLAASYGLEALAAGDIVTARDIGAGLIGQSLASAETLIAIQRTAESVVFGYREDGALAGMMALLPLREPAIAALLEGRFDACSPDMDLVARPGEAPACYYAWGIAATSKTAARAMIQASAALRRTLFWAIPSFTRAVTDDGRRLMASFGYRPVSDVDPHLIMAPATGRPSEAGLR